MNRYLKLLVAVTAGLALFSWTAGAQTASVATGTPQFGTYTGGPDVINLGNLNAHYTIPVINRQGRGLSFFYNLSYDSSVWQPVTSSGIKVWQPASNWGWTAQTQAATGYVTYDTSAGQCVVVQYGKVRTYNYTSWQDYAYHDPFGAVHSTPVYYTNAPRICVTDGDVSPNNFSGAAYDGSGYTLTASTPSAATVTSREGKVIHPPVLTGTGAASVADRNGNSITTDGSSFVDTTGTTVLTVTGSESPGGSMSYTWTNPSGGGSSIVVHYGSYTVQTNFGCSGISEYSAAGVPLVSSVSLPDGRTWQFSYEATPGNSGAVTGRIASVTLPAGGSIQYAYNGSNNGINCTDGSTMGFVRTTQDGAWTYSRTIGSAGASTTTIADPSGNQTVDQFQGIYLTESQAYQGSTSGTLLKTTSVCYNGAAAPCTATTVGTPISSRTIWVQLPDSLESERVGYYNGYGLPTETDEYDYGSGHPGSEIRKTIISYAALGNGIVDRPLSVLVETPSNGIVAETNYAYDETAVTPTSGTPQLAAVSGSRGNVTTVSQLVGGSTYLTRHFTYFDTGLVQTATDVNGAQTTYGYSDCGNSFPTLAQLPLTHTQYMSWNCTGRVMTSYTDGTDTQTTYNYQDPNYWRVTSIQDAAGDVTHQSYGSNWSESSLVFNNGASTVDARQTIDGLGRPLLAQRLEAPGSSNYDSVQTSYDKAGLPSATTLPYQGGAGVGPGSGVPTVTTTYDPLGRVATTQDAGGGMVTATWNSNDELLTVGPAPAGENAKSRQKEYDGLGRLVSVCEMTAAAQSASCGQSSGATGFLTKYTYNLLDKITAVSQNAQNASETQARSFYYDDLGRLTQETNPESGTTLYVYDTDATCGTSSGDLVRKQDANGNITCFWYDALHRLTAITYPSGPNAGATPEKHFVYDAATLNGTAMARVWGRLAEAYTGSSPITAEYFSYNLIGQISDLWQASPNSGGWYHLTAAWAPNQAMTSLSGLPGLPAWSWQLDGEGRPASTSAGATALVASTAFNFAGQPTALNLASGDGDTFGYDPSTGRATSYTFQVNGLNDNGTLTWNANGSLRTLSISDALNTQNTQTCQYQYDDLSRIASANCGSPWSQTFSLDPFGNLAKSGNTSFSATFSTPSQPVPSNRILSLPGVTPGYDADGDLTSDGLHSYTWNADQRSASIDGVSMTYDAFGRVVEINHGSSVNEVVYGPNGGTLALMSGQSVAHAWVPLPAGAEAVYNGTGLAYYLHPDWLGSGRLASTPGRGVYFDAAFAPYGEAYANGGSDLTALSFTGKKQLISNDLTTGLYDFPAREYAPNQGRWISPDPAGLGAVDPGSPQSWNRYAYVGNEPLDAVDPSGMLVSLGGDWFGGCQVDGVDMPCGTTGADLIGGGGLAACPSNDCGPYWDGHQYDFLRFDANGNGELVTANLDFASMSVQAADDFMSFLYSSGLNPMKACVGATMLSPAGGGSAGDCSLLFAHSTLPPVPIGWQTQPAYVPGQHYFSAGDDRGRQGISYPHTDSMISAYVVCGLTGGAADPKWGMTPTMTADPLLYGPNGEVLNPSASSGGGSAGAFFDLLGTVDGCVQSIYRPAH